MRFFNFRRPFDTSSARSRAVLMGLGVQRQMAVGIDEAIVTPDLSIPLSGPFGARLAPALATDARLPSINVNPTAPVRITRSALPGPNVRSPPPPMPLLDPRDFATSSSAAPGDAAEDERDRQTNEAQEELDDAQRRAEQALTPEAAQAAQLDAAAASTRLQQAAQKSRAELSSEAFRRKAVKVAVAGFVGFGLWKLLSR